MTDDDAVHEVIETDQSLNDYVHSLKMHDQQKVAPPAVTLGPVSVYQLIGYGGHLLVVNTCPFGEHGADEDRVHADVERQGWVHFATTLNADDEWSIDHYEPAAEARPLTWKAS